MTITQDDLHASNLNQFSQLEITTLMREYTIGDTGAETAAGGDGAVTLVDGNTGLYTGTFPTGFKHALVEVKILQSAALTIDGATVTAISASAGTFSATTWKVSGDPGAAAAADPANGDKLLVVVTLWKE